MPRTKQIDPLGQFRSVHGRAVAGYCRGVLDGSIVASRMVIRQVQRHVDDLQRAERGWDYHFDEARACRAIDFMQQLKLTGGAFDGMPFCLQPWQIFIIWSLFGWLRNNGLRRFRDAFLTLGRGNGKTPLAAAILLYLACFDQPIEPAAQIKIAATKRDQAKLCFDEVNQFIRQSPALLKRVTQTKWRTVWNPNGSTIGTLSKEDTKAGDGLNLHGVVIDELHAWHEELRELEEKIDTALAKRRQPLKVVITTAGNDRSKLWREQLQKSSQVLRGVYEDHEHFAYIAQIDEAEGDELPADDPHDSRVWIKANPNLGVSVQGDALQRMSRAGEHNPAELQKFLRYHCNIRVRSKLKPIDLKLWAACGGDLPDLAGRVCYGGIDLGWRDDLASFALAFPLDDGTTALKVINWICEESQRDLNAEPWRTWIRQRRLIVTPGDVTDPDSIYAEVRRAKKLYRLQTVAMDPANAMAVGVQLVNAMGVEVYHFSQTTKKYNEPVRILLDLIRDQKLLHGDDGLLTWAADNLSIKSDAAGLWMPDKQSSDEKIDPLVASIMAISESLYGKKKPAGYNQRGLRRLRGKA